MVSLVFVIAALPLRTRFQRWVDWLAYGARHNPDEIIRVFASRITTALDRETLARLLADEVAPSLLVRQSALLLMTDEEVGFVYAQGVDVDETPGTAQRIQQLLAEAGRYRPPLPAAQDEWGWVRLAVPVEVKGKAVGAWLFGRRDPDDYYPRDDVALLATLAGQVALAYENMQLMETLRELNRELVRSDESLHKQVARDLHDTALQQLFFIKQGLFRGREERATLIGLLEETIQALRRAIHGLRPPLLDQGLPLALQGLVDETRKMAGASPVISLQSNVDGRLTLSDEQATALYRIAQEALANALKHAEAGKVTVFLEAEEGSLRLSVADDGVGGTVGKHEYHYGLMGMRERAAMIGAQLHITSIPGGGMCVAVEVTV